MSEFAIYPGDMDMGPPVSELLESARRQVFQRVAGFAGNLLLRGGEDEGNGVDPPEYKENGGVWTDATSGSLEERPSEDE